MTLQRTFGAAVAASAVVGSLALSGTAAAAASGPDFSVRTNSAGQVQQLTPQSPINAAPSAGPRQAAAQHMPKVAEGFGIPQQQLGSSTVLPVGSGDTVRTAQVIDGVPVFGGEVVQALNAQGALVDSTGSVATSTTGSFRLSEKQATTKAVHAYAKRNGLKAKQVQVENVSKTWYAPSLASDGPSSVGQAAYQVELRAGVERHVQQFVNADTGAALSSVSLSSAALNRAVCDANRDRVYLQYARKSDLRCGTAYRLSRGEGDRASRVDDVNKVYNFFGETQSFYGSNTGVSDLTGYIGANYRDGNGTALRGTVRICDVYQCPYRNAFWDGEQMVFGEGVTTDDVTGHELTHGVTQNTNGLVYRNQSGAINESMSDVFGELVDITNGDSNDTSRTRWQIGDGSALGVIRDMQNPGAYNQPDRISSPDYYNGSADNGGVHTNSGVGNKAAYLITDGDQFNGYSIQGLGVDKAAQIYWTTQTMLTSNSDYADLGNALVSACNQNVRNGVAGTTASDCDQVEKAAKATEMIS